MIIWRDEMTTKTWKYVYQRKIWWFCWTRAWKTDFFQLLSVVQCTLALVHWWESSHGSTINQRWQWIPLTTKYHYLLTSRANVDLESENLIQALYHFFIFSVFSASPKCPTDLLDIRECETLASFLAHAPCSPSWQDDAGNPAACTSTTLFHAVLGFFWMELGLPAWCWMLVSSKKSPAGRSPELLTASLSPCMVIGSVETAWAWRHAPNTSQ